MYPYNGAMLSNIHLMVFLCGASYGNMMQLEIWDDFEKRRQIIESALLEIILKSMKI